MRKYSLTTLLIFIASYSFAQQGFGLKIYQNTDFFETVYSDFTLDVVEKIRNVNFNRVSFAIDIYTKRGYSHEIELMIPEFSKSLHNVQYPMNYEFNSGDDFEGKVSTASVRYELNKLFSDPNRPFTFMLGAGINPYYVQIEYEPNNSSTYFLSTKLYGFALNLTPRLNYKISNRFSMDLNIPLKVYDLRGETSRFWNPNVAIRDQKSTDTDHIFFETAYTIRLGLRYWLNG